MKAQRVCVTKFLGATDSRGSRVKATHVTTHVKHILPWDHALDVQENHARVAAVVLGGKPEWYASVEGGGYIMGRDPVEGAL